jgi:hypothetical protein
VLVIVLVLVFDGSVVPKQSLVRLRSPLLSNPTVHTGERFAIEHVNDHD